jgi:hypothetical protein
MCLSSFTVGETHRKNNCDVAPGSRREAASFYFTCQEVSAISFLAFMRNIDSHALAL